MTSTLRAPEEHARHVMDVVLQAAADATLDPVALSWMRCLNEYRLHPDRPRPTTVLERGELAPRLDRLADVVDCARHEMATLHQQLADAEAAVLLTDTDGVVLHMVCTPAFAAEVAPLGLRVGAMWSETEAGTNGMGTCLAAAGPIAVRREDHFYTAFTQLTCSAVPILDPSGRTAAVLDVTSRSSLMQQHLLVLLGMTARMIENRLIDQRFRNAHPLHFHTRPEFVYTLHEGKLALGDDGRVLAANRSALFQLGLESVEQIRSKRLEDIFQTSLADMLVRSHDASFHPVITYRSNASHRFYAVARQPAGESRAPLAVASPVRETAPAVQSFARASRDVRRSTPTFADPVLASRLDTARRVMARNTPLLLCGETGTGKEVFARAVHDASPHADGPFVAVNCASLPESLIESELFGYRAGAFTGAQRSGRRGKIAQADGGTLFLDEIGDMPMELQARLLRVLDERRVTPLGSDETQAVDFQLVSASHRDLQTLIAQGRFREDLYYRLNGIELGLPALRERSDRRELIRHLLDDEAGAGAALSAEAQRLLLAHPWPGNVRQLRHVLRTAVALSDGRTITPEHLPSLQRDGVPPCVAGASAGRDTLPRDGRAPPEPDCDPSVDPAAARVAAQADVPEPTPLRLNAIQANERQVLLQLLAQYRWNVSQVAKVLDVSRNTLYRKLHRLHIALTHVD